MDDEIDMAERILSFSLGAIRRRNFTFLFFYQCYEVFDESRLHIVALVESTSSTLVHPFKLLTVNNLFICAVK